MCTFQPSISRTTGSNRGTDLAGLSFANEGVRNASQRNERPSSLPGEIIRWAWFIIGSGSHGEV